MTPYVWTSTEAALAHQITQGHPEILGILADAMEEAGNPLFSILRHGQQNPKSMQAGELLNRMMLRDYHNSQRDPRIPRRTYKHLALETPGDFNIAHHDLGDIGFNTGLRLTAIPLLHHPHTKTSLTFYDTDAPVYHTAHYVVPSDLAQSVLSVVSPQAAKIHKMKVAYRDKT